jgi:epidermal growth factor receptor substrate 15
MANQANNQRKLFAFWQRRQNKLEISGYEVGDIQSDDPVLINPGSTLVGDVSAPEVIVSGLLTGHVICKSLIIRSGGQVWGNVYTISCQVEAGGRIQGWVTAVDEETYLDLKNTQIDPNSNGLLIDTEIPPEAPPTVLASRQDQHITLLQNLQAEAAAALAARAELEQDFDNRLAEVAGDATTRIATLQEDLEEANQAMAQWQNQAQALAKTLAERDEQVTRQSNELNDTREQLEERKQELLTTRNALDERNKRFDELFAAKAEVDSQLEAARQEIEQLNERIHTIETALQGSLQHSHEQEESLIRWQELAEVTEKKAQGLEKEIDNLKLQAEEAANTIELLREQRRYAEEQLEAAQEELRELRRKSTKPITAELSPNYEEQFTELEQKIQKYEEQILWYKANIKTIQAALEEANLEVDTQQKLIAQLEADTVSKQAQLDKWKQEAANYQQQLAEQNKKIEALQTSLQNLRQQANQKVNALKEKVLQAQLKQEASEIDFARLQKETRAQGQRLAEMQAMLIERELQLEKARELIQKQREFIAEMKQVTTQRIQKLSRQLKEAKRFRPEGQ